jgi:hypothetical protein
MTWLQVFGLLGAAAIIAAYALLQSGLWRAEQLRYSVLNGVGAVAILLSLWEQPNLPSIAIESFWLLISVVGGWRHVRARLARRKAQQPSSTACKG